MGAGPFGLRLLEPERMGHGLEIFVHLGVAVILFEGGLSLDPRQLRMVSGPLRNLLTVGVVVTGLGAAWLAHRFAGAGWPTAALFGAIVTVTGPTEIAPLLRHMTVPRRVHTVLLSEGLMIDPIGAVLAYFVLQWIDRAGLGWRTLATELLALSLTGAVLGFAAGWAAILLARHRHMADELRNLVTLALLLGAFLAAERQAPQSGILASVVMGLTLATAHIPDLNPLRAFKGQLTVLLISILFILLSGQLDLTAVSALGLGGLWVVLGLIFLVRPLSVAASIPTGELEWKEKAVLALTAPRGIVAAVASVSAIQLRATGAAADASILEGLVYLVILATCAWATLMAPLLPRWLGYHRDPSRRRAVLVGANPLSAALARELGAAGWTAVVVDAVGSKLKPLRDAGLRTVVGDARDAATYEEAGTERDSFRAGADDQTTSSTCWWPSWRARSSASSTRWSPCSSRRRSSAACGGLSPPLRKGGLGGFGRRSRPSHARPAGPLAAPQAHPQEDVVVEPPPRPGLLEDPGAAAGGEEVLGPGARPRQRLRHERLDPGAARRRGGAPGSGPRRHAVVVTALLAIREHPVGLGDLLEPRRALGPHPVGMVLLGEAAKRLLDSLLRSPAGHAQDEVVVHSHHSASTSAIHGSPAA